MPEYPMTCPCCGHTSLWNSFMEGCPICNHPKEEESEDE